MRRLPLILTGVALAATAAAQTPMSPAPQVVAGYLDRMALATVDDVLPPPVADEAAAFRMNRALVGTPRWDLAVADMPLERGSAGKVFACALGRPLPESAETLLHRVITDAGSATGPAKSQYARARPYVGVTEPKLCAAMPPAQDRVSYPSGHASVGWAWALILAELVPERAEAVLARGRAFGDSRVVCGFHHPSDVAAGREVAAGVVARLHAEPAFRADMERARADLAATSPAAPSSTCSAETAALATPIAR